MTRTINLILLIFALSGCGVYSNKFLSKPAKGLYDTSIDDIDELITSDLIDDMIDSKNGISRYYKLNKKLIGISE